ncbi:hypothetical protein FEM48_Zijuj01G0061900 [Ziziphus jujuba var. spinosa]|uniref:Cytochrome b561 domain-containing protein n=1 Tax=Ziziphus jujuba var. spinosa TaxID=714518 RepID=A0A978VZK8_ZIZJJ|nr:hypothetical protein FEM48_Zijuj01G0061900 [Ziziphus jujuba var. spinosa]
MIKGNFHKLSPQMTSNVRVHGLLLWVSMGLLMPAGILSIRMSVKEERGSIRARMLSVLVATAGAVLSIKNFENSFNNNHQRIGLALYIAIWIQAIMGFLRPHKGKKERSVWYFVHWIVGILISLVGIINIYTGLEAYHKRTLESTRLWTIIFTAQVSFITFLYLFQDKKEYIQEQGVILGNLETITPDQENISQIQNHKDLLPAAPCAKRNALRNLFD